jgi:TPR repeat protein
MTLSNIMVNVILAICLAVALRVFGPDILNTASNQTRVRWLALHNCDLLASEPHDPGRYTAGVTNDQMAVGEAVERCREAVHYNPREPRAIFEYGRALWAAQHYDEGFHEFADAEAYHYGPALKYIGDAYLNDHGLPPPEDRHWGWKRARYWYAKSAALGFPDGAKAVKEVDNFVLHNVFNKNLFQNPDFIDIMYTGHFERLDRTLSNGQLLGDAYNAKKLNFLYYVNSFIERLGSDHYTFLDRDCQPQVTVAGTTANDLNQIFTMFQTALRSFTDARNVAISYATQQLYKDQGAKDAMQLINIYSCRNAIGHRIIRNVNMTLPQLQQVLGL